MKSPFASLMILGALTLPLPSFGTADTHPCQSIAKECRAQGYSTGSFRSSGQGLVKDCLEKVLSGQTLAGVNVSIDTVSSCKSKWKSRAPASLQSATQASLPE